ncbi:MFS multidrug transporter [Podospora australis]|uniref:MFS multidrug transporter n=1 Tax=Podospora australis TaxID=1536484 RepID=A0AAN6WP85_9PEZI|nr:MFS multidrug transporter [Podospora australis]
MGAERDRITTLTAANPNFRKSFNSLESPVSTSTRLDSQLDLVAVTAGADNLETIDLTGPDEPHTHAHDQEKQAIASAESNNDQNAYLHGWSLATLLCTLTMTMFLSYLDTSIVSTAIPSIAEQFHSIRDIGWYGAGYQLANACVQPLAGKLYTFFPSKIVFLCFFAVFEIGSAICGTAESSATLIVGRAIAGCGAAGLSNGATIIMAAVVPLHLRPVVMGIGLGVSQLGLVLGPLVGGFYLNLPVGAAIIVPMFFVNVVEHVEKRKQKITIGFIWHKMDLLGFALLAPAVTMLLLALHFAGNKYPWNSAPVVSLLSGAGLMFTVFFTAEYFKGDDAILPLNILKRRIMWCSCLVMMFSVATSFCTSYFLPLYFQAVQNVTPIESGTYLLPNILTQLVGGIISGLLVSKLGYYLPFSVAAGILMTIGSGLISTYSVSTAPARWIGYQLVLGLGRGLGMQIPLVALQNFLPSQDLAIGTSMVLFGHTIGAAVFLSIAQTIFITAVQHLVPIYAPGIKPDNVFQTGGVTHIDPGSDGGAGLGLAICKAINRVFWMTTAAGGCALLFSFGLGWRSIKKPNKGIR